MSVCLKRVAIRVFVLLLILIPATSRAQGTAARQGKLLITVLDPSNAVVQEATVTIIGLESSTQAATYPPVKTGDKGVASIEGLAPGRYSVRAEFPGFETGLLRDIRVRAGDNKHVVILPLA